MIVTVRHRQSVFDLALQHFGSVEACFKVADRLGIEITDETTAGATFQMEENEIIDKTVVDYYEQNNIIPTTEEY